MSIISPNFIYDLQRRIKNVFNPLIRKYHPHPIPFIISAFIAPRNFLILSAEEKVSSCIRNCINKKAKKYDADDDDADYGDKRKHSRSKAAYDKDDSESDDSDSSYRKKDMTEYEDDDSDSSYRKKKRKSTHTLDRPISWDLSDNLTHRDGEINKCQVLREIFGIEKKKYDGYDSDDIDTKVRVSPQADYTTHTLHI